MYLFSLSVCICYIILLLRLVDIYIHYVPKYIVTVVFVDSQLGSCYYEFDKHGVLHMAYRVKRTAVSTFKLGSAFPVTRKLHNISVSYICLILTAGNSDVSSPALWSTLMGSLVSVLFERLSAKVTEIR